MAVRSRIPAFRDFNTSTIPVPTSFFFALFEWKRLEPREVFKERLYRRDARVANYYGVLNVSILFF